MGCGSSKSTTVDDTTSPKSKAVQPTSPSSKAVQPQSPSGKAVQPTSPSSKAVQLQFPSAAQEYVAYLTIQEDVITSQEDRDTYEGEFHPFIEFPVAHLLKESNELYTKIKLKGKPPYDDDGNILPYPPPVPKSQIFQLEKFQGLDQHALKAPKSLLNGSVEDLVKYLLQPAQGDVAKARVIFRWITGQDLSSLSPDFNESIQGTVLWELGQVKTHQADYVDLFLNMSSLAGIQGRRVRGYGKSSGYELGEQNNLEDFKASWAAVLIDKTWRLVNAHYASCFIVNKDPGAWMLIDNDGRPVEQTSSKGTAHTRYRCDNFYFFPNPEEYIYKLMPSKEEDWQLLARPITVKEFQEMAHLRSGFFELGLKALSHSKCNLYTDGGHVDIEIGLPKNGKRSFTYKLWVSTRENTKSLTFGNVGLDRFMLLSQTKSVLRCSLDFPTKGKFKLDLYGRNDDRTENDSGMYQFACSYIIHCEKEKEDCVPLPKNSRKEWGPGVDLEAAGLTPVTHTDALVEAEDGMAQLVFDAEGDIDILHKLHSNNKTKEELNDFVIHRKENNKILVDLKLPESGQYALNLFAKDADKEGSYPSVCTYLVSSDTAASDPTPFPSIGGGRCGAALNKELGIQLVSPSSALMTAPPSGEMDVIFDTPIPCDITHHLTLQTENGEEKFDEYTFLKQIPKQATISLRFPEEGVYKLSVYAKERGAEGSLASVYNCIINVAVPKPSCSPFPKSYFKWATGCELFSPKSGEVPANSDIDFAAVVAGAEDVAIIDEDWTHLKKDESNCWRGTAKSGEVGGELKLAAKMTDGSSYSHLLVFKVVAGSDVNKAAKREKEKQAQRELVAKRKEAEERKRQELFQKTKTELLDSMNARNLKRIRDALTKVENHGFRTRLVKECADAKTLMVSLERLERLKRAILDLDKATMAEIKAYNIPPPLVHDVMVASLLLLGEPESVTRKWTECRKQCSADLNKKVIAFDVTRLNPEIAARSRQILLQCKASAIVDISAAANAFYTWAVGIIEEIQSLRKGAARAKPAGSKRQKEIFDKQRKRS